MRVTEVTVFIHPAPTPPYIGAAKITLDNSLVIRDISILKGDGEDDYYIRFPTKAISGGRYVYLAHPINNETRETITKAIIDEYKRKRNAGKG